MSSPEIIHPVLGAHGTAERNYQSLRGGANTVFSLSMDGDQRVAAEETIVTSSTEEGRGEHRQVLGKADDKITKKIEVDVWNLQ